MSTFPTRILLATDGSEDAALAARAAVDLSNRVGSELYVVHAWHSVLSAHFEAFLRTQLNTPHSSRTGAKSSPSSTPRSQ